MLEGRHYQNAYVTRDIDKWIEHFKATAKIDQIFSYEGAQKLIYPDGGEQVSKLAFIWIGGLQYELIQPIGGNLTLYSEALPEGNGLQFHHICMRIDDWDEFRARVDQQDLPIAIEGDTGGLKFLYLDARATLGHYLEYVWTTEERWAQMGWR